MRVYRSEDFEKMARSIVDSFVANSSPLEPNIVKASEDFGLNPDQIRHLVQLANTMAHLALFEKKTDGDKVVEFNPADPEVVLKKIYVNGEPVETPNSTASPCDKETDFMGDFPDLIEKLKEIGQSSETGSQSSTTEPSTSNNSMLIIKIRKVASELENKSMESLCEYREEFDKLASEFAKMYGPDFEEFEKDALTIHGSAAVPVLTELRQTLRLPMIKTAVINRDARVVDSAKPELTSMNTLLKLAAGYKEYSEAHQFLKQELGGVL